jgi:multiple sugar transport system permease protein
VLPSLLGLLFFTAFPVLFSFVISLFDWNLISTPRFVGFDNYTALLTRDRIFREVAWNTLIFLVSIVPLQLTLSLLLALMLSLPLRGMSLFRVVYYMPVVTPIIAAALIFQWMFDRNYGVLSALIWDLGVWLDQPLAPPDWLNHPGWAKVAVVILTLWKNVGFSTIIFLAGLQAIPRDLYDAASIDGANDWQRFWAITLPLLSPTTFFVLIILCIGAFQLFGESFILTRGGPGYATMTIVQYIYQSAFEFFRMGRASAIAWILFAVIFCFTLIQFYFQRRWVYYETGER